MCDIWVVGYCLFERLSFLTNALYTCIHLWVIHIHIHDSKWCNIHVHIFYVLKLGLYIIQKITITDDHFKRNNACMFDKNSETLAHIIFILCWKSEIAGKKSLHLLHVTLLKHLIPEKICCNMLLGRCSPVYPAHLIFNNQSERPRCFCDTQKTFRLIQHSSVHFNYYN